MPATQANRILSLITPLGPDVLTLGSFSGTEGMSRLFTYQLQMSSESATSIEPKDIVGKNVTWSVQHKDAPPRFFNGFINRFSGGELSQRNTGAYRAQVVPWLWFLTRTANCRIFQNKSVPEIVEQVFKDLGFSDYVLELNATYPKRVYCVQYRETAFNFVSRVLEEEGIFYFFRHDDGEHMLVLADAKGSYTDLPAEPTPPSGLIETWDHQFEFRPGRWSRTDYNFETPSTSLFTNTNTLIDLPGVSNFEMFDFPGDYMVKGAGDTGTKLRMEEEEVPYEVVTATSASSAFTPGGKFVQEGHDIASEKGKGYVVTSIEHSGVDVDFTSSNRVFDYRNKFQCIPDSVTFRPGRSTPRPIIAGAQTAVVVGPAGEEIYVDKYGRVKVQFFWDREGKRDENSSCWIRVSENWAGKNWGIVFHPRIGQEVIVEFLEGDPDRPIVTGRVYNAEQMPPYDLPDNKTQSGVKTRSSLKGTPDHYNEIRFEDKKGSEQINIHAEKDMDTTVENNHTLTIGTDPKGNSKKNGTQTTTIFGDQKIVITKGDFSFDVQAGTSTTHVKGNVVENYDAKQTTTVVGDQMNHITGGHHLCVVDTGHASLHVNAGNRYVNVGAGFYSLIAATFIEEKVGGNVLKIESGGKITLVADAEIALSVGGNYIKITTSGIELHGAKIVSVADGAHEISGANVKITGTPVKVNC